MPCMLRLLTWISSLLISTLPVHSPAFFQNRSRFFSVLAVANPRSGELRTQKLKSHLVRTHSLNVLPLKTGAGQYIATHTTITARDFLLANFYPSGPFTCIFSQNISRFFLCWLWLTHGSCVGPQNEMGHPAGGRFPC